MYISFCGYMASFRYDCMLITYSQSMLLQTFSAEVINWNTTISEIMTKLYNCHNGRTHKKNVPRKANLH